MAKVLKVTQLKSVSGRPYRQKRTIEALGLKRIRHAVEHKDTPQIRGMVNKVKHLVSMEES